MKPEEVNIENVYAYYKARLTQQETEKETLESRRDLSMDKIGRLCVLAIDIKMTQITVAALEKQMPKKPIKDEFGWDLCPECKKMTEDAEWCQYCGQKLEEEGGY